jgi:hypothetical protein
MSKYVDMIPDLFIREKWSKYKKSTPQFERNLLRHKARSPRIKVMSLDPVSKKMMVFPLPEQMNKQQVNQVHRISKIVAGINNLKVKVAAKKKKNGKTVILQPKGKRKQVGVQGRQKKYINKV